MMISNDGEMAGTDKILIRRLQKAMTFILFLLFTVPQLSAENGAASEPATESTNSALHQDESQNADFSFSAPKGFAGFRIGRFFPRAQSDIYDLITDQLTLEKSDFQAWDFGFDGGVNLQKRVDLIFSVDYLRRAKDTMFRDLVDANDLPITQTTRYQQLPLTGGIKFLLIPRGRQVGKFAWVPSSVVPYISGGAGILWYRLEQEGDFVDEATLELFPAHLRSSGWTPTVYAGGGADIHIFSNAYLALDLRYSWAKSDLKKDFVAFDPIDLAGLRVTAGLQWHF